MFVLANFMIVKNHIINYQPLPSGKLTFAMEKHHL